MKTRKEYRLKVLLNALSARRGGVQTYLLNFLTFLPEDVPADIFVLAHESVPLSTQRANIRKLRVKWPVENPIVRAAWERIYLPKLLSEIQADVFFCPGGIVGAKIPPACKTVAMFRNMLPFDPVQRRRYPVGYMRMRHWMLERLLLNSIIRADTVIFISEYGQKVVEARTQHHLRNAVVIPHGINPVFRAQQQMEHRRPDWLTPCDYLLYVSDIDFYKSQVEVVQAFGLVKQRRRTREKLLLVGSESSSYGRKVRSEIRRLGLIEDVILTGRLPYEQMPEVYHHALITIFASQCENCPNILLEALAAGQPIIASNYPPIPEFVGDSGIYFDPRSPSELAEQMLKLLDDPSLRRELSDKATGRSLHYDWSRTAAITWQVIQKSVRQQVHQSD